MLKRTTVTYSKINRSPEVTIVEDESEDELVQARKYNINHKSLKTLDPKRKLNDDVVDVYLNIVLDRLHPTLREKIHLFSNFFFSKLKNLSKLDENAKQKMVQRWDKHVKLFDKSYLVIPICDGGHWFMVIICFPMVKCEPVVVDLDQQEPSPSRTNSKSAIIVFDSFRFQYIPKFAQPIREYLRLRWIYERPQEPPKVFSKETLPMVYAKSCKQHNSYDCGVFMLYYFEKFFSNPLQISYKIREGKEIGHKQDWKVDGPKKREDIRKTILQKATTNFRAVDFLKSDIQ